MENNTAALIKKAHESITKIKGHDYAPNVHEIQEWIDKYEMMDRITITVKPTPEQLSEINRLMHQKDSRIIPKGKTMSPMMEYLVEHFGKEVGESLFKSHDQEPKA